MATQELDIPIFYGIASDLSKIDLSFINCKIVPYGKLKFRNYVKTLLPEDVFLRQYKSIVKEHERHMVSEYANIRRYAIVPLDINKPFLQEQWWHFYEMMLSIYPSDFSLVEMIHLHIQDTRYYSVGKSYYDFHSSSEDNYYDNFMYIFGKEFSFVQKYLNEYFYSSIKLNYVKYMLSLYANSFSEMNPIYRYLGLIICLEVILEGTEQLTYRIKRNTALLCGNSITSCERIFYNVDQLYKLRSAIVHGEINPKYKNFKEYYVYLKTLVARLIRELVVHNIPKDVLNQKLTSTGFGQNKLISPQYQVFKYPLMDNIRLSYRKIQKY